jgi:hypothetical protein
MTTEIKQFYTICLLALLSITVSGQTPQVTTDKRFVRGATMVFGRISRVSINGGSSLQKRGFCLSEKPVPTIGDTISTKTLDNNGTIYYFENLKPATKYYMRAYATNKDGLTGYGDVIKFYTLPKGAVTYSYNNGGNEAQNKRINDALTQACSLFCNLTSIKKHFSVGYGSGTPTADCNYRDDPWMNVGPNEAYQKTGTIMHEMQHGLGVINYSTQWNGNILRSGNGTGQWLGDRVSAFLDFWDNTTGSRLNGDTQHMWPYGVNGAHEDDGTLKTYFANAMIGQALGEDGLQHLSTTYADPYYSLEQEDNVKYYIKNESADRGLYTSYLKPTATGALKWVTMTTEEAAQNDSTAWYITFTPQNQYYQLRNAATGQYLTYSSSTIKTVSKTNLTANENWHLMKGRVNVDGQRGYWVIHPEQNWTPKCLQASVNGNTTAATFNIANSAETQRWLIMTIDEAQVAETKAVAQVKKQAENALAQVKKLLKVAHTEDVTGADDALTTALGTIETQLSSATTIPQLLAMIAETETAGMTFLGGVTPTGTPFDLTYKLVNPTIDENSDGWNGSPAIDYGCGEFYQNTFDFNQTVKDLPAGTYVFSAQAFQRPGPYSSAASVAVNATIYAGSQSQKLKHIKDGSQSRKVGTGREQSMDGKYIPDDMQAAAAYFKKGYYENRLVSTLATQGGSLKVGIKSTSMPSSYWAIFDAFRLYFYGSKTAEDVTAVKGVVESDESGSRQVFDLQGRRVSTPTKGLYIINGKKVLIK